MKNTEIEPRMTWKEKVRSEVLWGVSSYSFWEILWTFIKHPILSFKLCDFYNGWWYEARQKVTKFLDNIPWLKASRFTASVLSRAVHNNKVLDKFSSRTCDTEQKYYYGSAKFGYVKVIEKQYLHNGKPMNLFVGITIPAVCGDETVEDKANQTEEKIRVLYKGFVFTKRKALKVIRKVSSEYSDVYKAPHIVNDSYEYDNLKFFLKMLKTGKTKFKGQEYPSNLEDFASYELGDIMKNIPDFYDKLIIATLSKIQTAVFREELEQAKRWQKINRMIISIIMFKNSSVCSKKESKEYVEREKQALINFIEKEIKIVEEEPLQYKVWF